MSNFSTIYDQINTKLASLFPSKTEIPLPESLPDNNINFLRDGYGLVVKGSSQGVIDTFHTSCEIQSFEVVLAREIIRLESEITAKHTAVKALREDLITLRLEFAKFSQLGIDSNIQMITFAGTSAVESIKGDKFSLITSGITFDIEISENITA